MLHDAIADRPLDGSRNTANVVYARIVKNDEGRFDPVGDSWPDWTPRTDNAEWNDYLGALAAAADRRMAELGQGAAKQPPPWAVEAFGAVPDDTGERSAWERQAGTVAMNRELRGHDDPTEALGPAPKPGQVEAYAAYRAAWRTLGRPEIERVARGLTGLPRRASYSAPPRSRSASSRSATFSSTASRSAAWSCARQRASWSDRGRAG